MLHAKGCARHDQAQRDGLRKGRVVAEDESGSVEVVHIDFYVIPAFIGRIQKATNMLTPLIAGPRGPAARSRLANAARPYASSSRTDRLVPLWIDGKAVASSSAGTVSHSHAKTGQPSAEVVMAGEKETWVLHGSHPLHRAEEADVTRLKALCERSLSGEKRRAGKEGRSLAM